MTALVVHASKQGDSSRILFASPILAHAKARGFLKAGWQVHVTDSDGRVFQPDRLDDLLKFDRKKALR
jgi:hypothetical protein